jgi:CheY-like chemotaxis protein
MNDDVKAGRHAADLTGLSILVVEDEFLLAEALVDGLERCGASVVGPVPTVEKALKAVASADRIDFAVLDINLRGQMVYPVADALKERGVPFCSPPATTPRPCPGATRMWSATRSPSPWPR